ncbi:DUF5753 domain-containing protein [Streptomyces kronopolitis]|uniref:DUF5753 domain-containing protein n=1 Tax=Streptomyces kronopolitis TaxID=1612435 RepID=UPI0036B1BE6E
MPSSPHHDASYTEWRHKVRDGLEPLQNSLVQLFQETRLFRVYSSTLMPGLLQTEGYAAAVLRIVADFEELPVNDATEAARARVERSRVIHDPERRFVLLVEESVLYNQLGDTEVMISQLEYLLAAEALPSVSLEIIPMATRERVQWPRETFHVYDERLVSVELVSAKVNITQPSEISLNLKAFEQLHSMAVDGPEARALILKAREQLR